MNTEQPLFISEAERRTVIFADEITKISEGNLSLHTNEKLPLLNAVMQTSKSIEATSLVESDLPTWNTGSGARYFEENEKALGRGVKIRRTFLYSEMTDNLSAMCDTQAKQGFQVYTLHENRLEPEHRVDIVLFDESLLYKSINDNNGKPLSNSFSIREADITSARRILDYINGISEKWDSAKYEMEIEKKRAGES